LLQFANETPQLELQPKEGKQKKCQNTKKKKLLLVVNENGNDKIQLNEKELFSDLWKT